MKNVGSSPRVGVCGAGAMGGGIAMLAATAGAQVIVLDVDSEGLAAGRRRVEADVARLAAKDKLAVAADQFLSRLKWTTNISDLVGCDLIIEAIVERLDAKADLFKRLEAVVEPTTILASNTSSLSIARLGRELARPERFLGLHFFNPATMMKLVEIISGPATSAEVVSRADAAVRAWGKLPVRVADVPGFIVNRVARPFYAEGFRAWQEGINPSLVDQLLREGAGFRMGPLELSDLIGQDVNFAVAKSIYDAYFGVTRFVPQRNQAALVDAGRLGRKSGQGVFDYRAEAAPRTQATWAAASARGVDPPALKLGKLVSDRSELAIRVTRGKTARMETTEAGRPVAIIDWCRSGSSSVGFAATSGNVEIAAAHIAALGLTPFHLPDRPGLLVARTLAQLANSAADAVLEEVSDEVGVDAALCYGANYPFGPMQWAHSQPAGLVAETLAAIAQCTGQQIYAPSEQWSRE